MIPLLLAIVCSSAMALIFKYNEGKDGHRYALISANYGTAVLVSLGLTLAAGISWFPTATGGAFWPQVAEGMMYGTHVDEATAHNWAWVLGPPVGIALFFGIFFYQISVREQGVGLAGAFAKLGILVPMILSLVLWKELPSGLQTVGLFLAIAAIVVVATPRDGRSFKASLPLLLLSLSVGMADFSKKIFQKIGSLEHKPLFLLSGFGCALLISLIPLLRNLKGIQIRDVGVGIAVGVPNLLCSYFLISALEAYPAAVIFPVFSAGTIVTIFLGGRFIFGEYLDKPARIAIALTLPALVLMNL